MMGPKRCLAASRSWQATSPEKMIVGRIEFGEGMVGGECPFIPAGDEEDDGYIATFVGRADGTGNSGERQRDSTTSISDQHASC